MIGAVRVTWWLLVLCAFVATPTEAQVPHLIRYQGQIADSQGVPVEGPYTLTFRLYDAETDGAELWAETQLAVPLTGGHFSVLLGQVTPLSVDWSQPCWLSIQVITDPNNPDPGLAPRQRITSVPLAIKAETADSAERADQLTTPITTSTITDDSNRLVPSGAIVLWTGANCPAGYSRLSTMDGALLKVGAAFSGPSPASSSEVASHSHAFSGSTSTDGSHEHNLIVEMDTGGESALYSTGPNQPFADGFRYIDPAGSHSHSVSGTNSTVGNATIATVILCRKE